MNRLSIAAECLRQIWQSFDAGGVSMGRSREAVWLETAMDLLSYDNSFSNLADEDPRKFDEIAREARYMVTKEKIAERDREMGLETPTA